ncbi:hypothetical protein JCM16358_19440 [Halanaerocella petrolearia]
MKVSRANNNLSTESISSNRKQVHKSQIVNNNLGSEEDKLEKEFTKEELEEGVEQLNEAVQPFHKELNFELHEESERMMTKVVNTENNEVIREIPPKEVLDMLGKIKEMVGLILDKKI